MVHDIMQYTEQNNIPGMLFLIDFEKAIDSISWKFTKIVMHFFNFGNSIIQWIITFMSNKI